MTLLNTIASIQRKRPDLSFGKLIAFGLGQKARNLDYMGEFDVLLTLLTDNQIEEELLKYAERL